MRIFRLAIPVSEIGSSRRFYETLLDLQADDTVPSRLYFHCGGVIVALIDWTVEALGPFHSTPENLYFATDQLDAVYRRAVTVGAHELSPIGVRPWGERSFYCRDLDGNRLCFVDEGRSSSVRALPGRSECSIVCRVDSVVRRNLDLGDVHVGLTINRTGDQARC